MYDFEFFIFYIIKLIVNWLHKMKCMQSFWFWENGCSDHVIWEREGCSELWCRQSGCLHWQEAGASVLCQPCVVILQPSGTSSYHAFSPANQNSGGRQPANRRPALVCYSYHPRHILTTLFTSAQSVAGAGPGNTWAGRSALSWGMLRCDTVTGNMVTSSQGWHQEGGGDGNI